MSTYVPIQAITLSATAASVTFTGIPQTYTDLVLVNTGTFNTGDNGFALTFNSDSGSNYSTTYLYGDGTSALSTRASNQTSINAGRLNTSFGLGITHIMNYTNTTTNKTVLSRGNSGALVNANVGLWRATPQAITSLTISVPAGISNFSIGSTFTLYGIGSGAPKAFGGDEVRTDGTYWYHIFRSSGRFDTVQDISNVDFLVIAGGGAGGANTGGNTPGAGGGAGGFRTSAGTSGAGSAAESKLSLSANTSYTVTVGAGGTGGSNAPTASTSGSNSVFSTITSTGGGRGGGLTVGSAAAPAENGGSGGGGRGTGAGGTGTANQGRDGAAGFNINVSGGGGGSSVAAVTPGSQVGGTGGAGTASSITGTSVTYAGGGGGGNVSTGGAGAGGSGGGGAGGSNTSPSPGTAGTVNTGSGGGGGGSNGGGGNGGSGIVIVRYLI